MYVSLINKTSFYEEIPYFSAGSLLRFFGKKKTPCKFGYLSGRNFGFFYFENEKIKKKRRTNPLVPNKLTVPSSRFFSQI